MQVEALLLQSKTDESSKEHTCYDETYFIIPRSRSSSACMQPVSFIQAIASLRRHHEEAVSVSHARVIAARLSGADVEGSRSKAWGA